jgi:hypothetical protein
MSILQEQLHHMEIALSNLLAFSGRAELPLASGKGDPNAGATIISTLELFLEQLPTIQQGVRYAIIHPDEWIQTLATPSTYVHSDTSSEGEKTSITTDKLAEWKWVYVYQGVIHSSPCVSSSDPQCHQSLQQEGSTS